MQRWARMAGPGFAVSRNRFTGWRRPADGGSVRFSRGCANGVSPSVRPIPASSPCRMTLMEHSSASYSDATSTTSSR
eukprot:6203958-Pleurochrysis_carterae.AAC.1